MGKGSRLRRQRRENASRTPGREVPPDAAQPETTGRDAEGLDPEAARYSAYLLQPYLHLALDMADLGLSPHTTQRDQTAGRPGRDDEQLPLQVTRHAQTIARYMDLVTPEMRLLLLKTMFAEAAGWIAESGYEPDLQQWFTGAASYLEIMVPPQHRDQAQRLLDYDRLQADEQEAQSLLQRVAAGEDLPGPIVAFSVDDPAGALWTYDAIEAAPAATMHAVCALLTWLFGAPGAVVDAPGKARAIADRITRAR